jgi:Terminase small subunit
MTQKELTPKQIAFADGIIAGKSSVQAYRDAGYGANMSDKAASSEAAKLRKHPGISAYVEAGLSKVANDSGITRESHVAQLTATRDAATKKGDHATALRCQEALAAFLKVKDEPAKADSEQSALSKWYREALRVLSFDELEAHLDAMERLHGEAERLEAGGKPLPERERWHAHICRSCGAKPNMDDKQEAGFASMLIKRGHMSRYEPATPLQPCGECGRVKMGDHPESLVTRHMRSLALPAGVMDGVMRDSVSLDLLTDHVGMILKRGMVAGRWS